jgi:Lipocalin-like domain
MKMIRTLCCSLLLFMPSFAQSPVQGANVLIGTWKLVEFADLDKSGKWQYWFGEHPRGYFVYDETGHVHIQIMKVPPLAPFPEANSDDGKPPSAEHALATYNAYFAYFGTYTVDAKKNVATHHVEGSLAPDYTDTDQPRPFKLTGTDWRSAMARRGDECWSACTDFASEN